MLPNTINREKWNALPVFKKAPSYRLQDSPGNGCFLEPPGHPSYFTRSVYTQHGNNPSKGPQMELFGRAVETAEMAFDARHALLESLFEPLPYEHPRVQAWERAVYAHLAHCYADTQNVEPMEYGPPATLIFPVPYYKLKTFVDDPRFSDEWRTKERAAVEQANADLQARYAAACTPEHHEAVSTIRKHYPNAPIRQDYIDNPPAKLGNWYERLEERPAPESCPGDRSVRLAHNNEGWCQFCGYTANK